MTQRSSCSSPQPRLVEKRRAFLAALRTHDVDLATRLMRNHLASVHRLLEPFVDAAPARSAAAA